MDISFIALNRIVEESLEENSLLPKFNNKKKMLLSDVRKMEDEAIVQRLREIGIDVHKETFSKTIKEFSSSEMYYLWLIREKNLKLNDIEEDSLWMGLTVIWERWFPNIPNFEMLDDKMQLGYRLLQERKTKEACNIWWDGWNNIIYLMDQHKISGIQEFDNKFRGSQSVFNWSSDFEMALHNLGNTSDKSFLQKRIEFCTEFIERSEDKYQLNIENFERSIAESYIKLGQQDEGDALFEKYLKEDPQWGWGWIGWSDCYWIFHGNEDKDYKKAEHILKKALTVPGLRDKADVMERLLNLYEDTDRKEEVNAIKRELDELVKTQSSSKKNIKLNTNQPPKTKVGRNAPCPCGSGRKYKHCCGR